MKLVAKEEFCEFISGKRDIEHVVNTMGYPAFIDEYYVDNELIAKICPIYADPKNIYKETGKRFFLQKRKYKWDC